MRNLKKITWTLCVLICSCFFSACEVKDFTDDDQVAGGKEKYNSQSLSSKSPISNFLQTGPVGGGFPNIVTWDPNVQGKIYYGSDIGGTGYSTDWGKNFKSTARGLGYEDSHQKIATLNAIDMGSGNTIIVGGTGNKGIGGEVISSTDGGNNWTHDSDNNSFASNSFSSQNSALSDGLPTSRPRSTDYSLIQRIGGQNWIAGTYKDGVYISKDNRVTWSRLDINGNKLTGNVYVRAMAMSPYNSNEAFIGLYGDGNTSWTGLWKISNLTWSHPTATQVTNSNMADVVESIVVLGNSLYVACGKYGIRKVEENTNGTFTVNNISGNIINNSNVMATTIHGVITNNGSHKLVVGTASPKSIQGGSGKIWVSYNGGSTWFDKTDNENISNIPHDGTDELIVFKKHGNWALGQNGCDIASIQISPHNSNRWVVCATSAIWTTLDNGNTWKPANGFQILTYRDVEINSNGDIAAGNVDHDVVFKKNGNNNWATIGLSGGGTTGHGIAFSPNGNELAFTSNERDSNQVIANFGIANILNNNTITYNTNLPSNKRAVGLAWVKKNNNNRIIAAVDDGKIKYIDQIGGSWSGWTTTNTTSIMTGEQDNKGLRCSVVTDGGANTFVYDRKTGVWRTNDHGSTWDLIYGKPVGKDEGYLAYDNNSPKKLYISAGDDVYRMNNPSGLNPTTDKLDYPLGSPGAMALDDLGNLVVYGKSLNEIDSDCRLYINLDPKSNNKDWDNIASPEFLKIAPPVTDMDIKGNTIVLVTSGKGMLVSTNY